MSESFQHGSRDEHRNGNTGPRRSGGGAERDGDRPGGAPRRRYDDGRRSFSRDARDGDRSTGRTGGDSGGRSYGDRRREDRPAQGDRRDDRRGGYGDRGRDERSGQGERRGGFSDRRDDRRGAYGDRRDDRRGAGSGERGPRREGEGYRGGRDDRRGAGYGGRGRDERPGQGERRGGFPDRRDDRRDDRRGGYGDRTDVSTHRHRAPEIDEDVTGRELDKPTRAQLGALEPRNAEAVAMHLVMAGRYLLDDPELALEHALAAGRRGGRIAAVREATGIAAYEAEDWSLALKELRTFRRMTGSEVHLPLMVDCERALGRLDKAVELATSEAAQGLDAAEKVELSIVLAGMRRDQGDAQGAVDALTIPQLDKNRGFSYSPRLFRAYAEALRGVGRDREALTWDRQAVVAEAALGTGQFAEPEIFDLVGEEPEAAEETGVVLADAEDPAAPDEAAAGTAAAALPAGRRADGDLEDHPDDESDDVLDEGAEEGADEDQEESAGSEEDLDPDDDADIADGAGDAEDDPRHG